MAKKYILKALSVGLSLVMCAGMVTPAFAARVLTNDEINWVGTPLEETRWGNYHGTLKGYEEEGETKYDYYLDADLELQGTLAIGKDADGNAIHASIDLNGYELALNKGLNPAEIGFEPNNGAPYPADSDSITKRGSVIVVEGGATLDLYGNKEVRDEDGELVDKGYEYGKDESGDLTEGSVTGGTGTNAWKSNEYNDWSGFGGGILVRENGTLNMTGGRVENNIASGHGGGLAIWSGTINLDGVTVSGNKINNHGSGLAVYDGGTTSIVNCVFEENTALRQSVIMISNGTLYEFNNNIIKNNIHLWETVMIDPVSGHGPSNPEGNALCGNTDGWTGEATNNYRGITSETPGHIWVEFVVDEAPTCTEEGAGHWVCKSGCEEAVVLSVDPSNHSGHDEYSEVTQEPQIGVPGERSFYCDGCDALLRTEPIPALTSGNPSGTTPSGNGGRVPDSTTSTPVTEPEADATIGIEDEAVPLAGIFTRADAIGYLWEQAGRPEAELSDFPDVPEEHYWAVAIGWAQDMGIALPDEDGNFRPDDMVLRSVEDLEVDPEGELQEFLNRYAVFAGVELDDGELFIELDGAAGDVIMGEEAQEIFNLFFSLLEKALADQAA